jgi:hypothetical protein
MDKLPRGGCDPSIPVPPDVPTYHLTSSAVGIDATYPLDQTWPEEADVPRLGKLLPAGAPEAP